MGAPTLPSRASPFPNRRPRRLRLMPVLLPAIAVVLYLQFFALPRWVPERSLSGQQLSQLQLDNLEAQLKKCEEFNTPPVRYSFPVSSTRWNPRWNPSSGQNGTVILRNVTLFDGDLIRDEAVDITFKKGIITSITPFTDGISVDSSAVVVDSNGRFVTPGLVDMHSHHLVGTWPAVEATEDTNEVHPDSGPLSPFVRALDSIKPYDEATTIIASGGVTSSLILPGSANIMGGEAVMVKNLLRSGEHGEEVVEELLLEHGTVPELRRRYMKMACGENPSRVYGHTRMGDAWVFRHHMTHAKEIREKQDAWCLSAAAAKDRNDVAAIAALLPTTLNGEGGLPEVLELDSTVAMLRGKIGINVHCYEPEDMEDMLLHSKEFGFRIQAFHHALEAWKVPELIKASGENITIATFSEFALYKQEAYGASLHAGKVLAEHGVPVAYKSDHGMQETSAQYLLFQAATAHSFGLPEVLALQSVTSVPARSLEMDHRIGFALPGYDADLVVWNSHPLSLGAAPLQVYIDGRATLASEKMAQFQVGSGDGKAKQPRIRPTLAVETKQKLCHDIERVGGKIVISGITKSFLESSGIVSTEDGDLTMVLDGGHIDCFGPSDQCATAADGGKAIKLESGHVLPGLTAFSSNLGLTEIVFEPSTGDGIVGSVANPTDPNGVAYAKYGVHLDGRAFKRARIGGITKAITAPIAFSGEGGAFLIGVSTGIKTSGKKTILDGGIFQDDIALHFGIGQAAKSISTPTISSEIGLLRKILFESKGKDNIYGQAANGTFPIVVHVENKYDIMQLIKLKQDHGSVNLILYGASEAPSVAAALAEASIPIIFTGSRPAPDSWEKKDVLTGPPLTVHPVSVLVDAGVKFGLATAGFSDSHIHNLPLEAGWAAKYSNLTMQEAVDLVSRNVEEILDLNVHKEKEADFVVYEGNPLEFGASVVLAVDGGNGGRVVDCWPDAD